MIDPPVHDGQIIFFNDCGIKVHSFYGLSKMEDQKKTKKQLVSELMELRQRIARLELLENERKRAEEALRESEAKFEQLFDEAPVGYHEYDTQGRITRVNHTELEMLGYTPEEMIGQPVWKFIGEEEISQRAVLAKLVGTMSPGRAFERTYRRKDGTTFPVLIEDRLLLDENGKIIGIRSIIQDITDRKRAEEEVKKAYVTLKETQDQLVQSEKMASIGQLAAGIAHEINNPAGFIISNLDILNKYVMRITPIFQRYVQLETSLSQYQISELSHLTSEIKDLRHQSEIDHILSDLPQIVSESLEGTHRIKKIVHDLRTFSHAEVAEPKYAIVNDLLDFSLNLIWNEITHKAEVVKEYTDVPKLFCYPQQLRQVFLNILMNAVQAMEKRGKIIIKTYEKDKNIFIEMIDTGSGIPEEVQNRIFEPFFTTKEVGKGTGLGLSVAYGIIKRHKGDITVKSKIGEGTHFMIRLPIGGLDKNEEG
jgi:two-component system NtrC family sensor kinase